MAINGFGIFVAIATATATCGVSNIPNGILSSKSGQMYILFSILGALIFLFFYWKRLKEDFGSKIIFSSGFLVILGVILGYLASLTVPIIPNSYWFFTVLTGSLIGFAFSVLKFKLSFFETLEATGVGLLFWLGLIFVAHSMVMQSFTSLGAALFITALILIFYYFDSIYKKFTWYKSGRVGFAGLVTLGAFFLIRATIAMGFEDVLSFVGKTDVFVSTTIAFVLFLALFILTKK